MIVLLASIPASVGERLKLHFSNQSANESGIIIRASKAFKAIKALVAEVSAEQNLSVELLASRRQINQLLNWHWKLKPQQTLPELVSGWRGELMSDRLNALLREYPQ